jgi:enediyne polyketide synthase
MCVAGRGAVGCDVEPVVARPETVWRDLLGGHTELAHQVAIGGGEANTGGGEAKTRGGEAATDSGEGMDTAATRVWAAVECLRKSGCSAGAPLALLPSPRAGWVLFASGERRVATLVTAVRDVPEPVVFAMLTEGIDNNG